MGSHKKFDSSSEDSDADRKRSSARKKEKSDLKKRSPPVSQSCSQDSSEIPRKKTKNDYSANDDNKEFRASSKRRDLERERDHKHRDDRSRNSYRDNDGSDGDKRRDRRDNCNRREEYARRDHYETKREINIRNRESNKNHPSQHERRGTNLTKDEIAKQRKMLWSKPKSSEEITNDSAQTLSSNAVDPDDKKAAVWTSSITASGVGGQQASKFLKLMGIKAPAPLNNIPNEDLQKEHDRQQKMMSDLDKQYQVARESTHTGRGMGLGFH